MDNQVTCPIEFHMTWVKVTGKAAFPIEGGHRKPLIQNAAIEKIDAPQDPYLY